jgi:nitroreductase
MNIDELIKNRRATPPRFISGEKIEKEKIQRLLENANWAPNHKKTEPWRFIVFQGENKQKLAEDIFAELRKRNDAGENVNMQKAEKFKGNLSRVSVAVAIIFERDAAERLPEWEEIAAVSMAVQNMWLTATEMELGAFWASPGFLPQIHDVVGVKENQKLLGFFFVGKISMDFPSPGRGPIEEKVEWK